MKNGTNLSLTSELSRELTLFQIMMMGLGMMIGAGVFLGVGNAIYISGPGGVVLTFVLNGIIAMFTAFSYAELSSAIPHTGGAYNYARIGFGKGTSFLAGWMEWFASSVAGSLYAVTFSIYVVRYLEVLGLLTWLPLSTHITEKYFAVIIACLFFYINYRGASETGKIGAFFTLGQTIFLIAIGLFGIYVVIKDPSRIKNFTPFLPHGWSKLLITMGFTYVAFEGFEVIAQTGDEAIDPKRNLPKAMIYSVLIVTLTYAIVSFATVIAVKAGTPGIDGEPWQWIGSFRERGFGEAISRLIPFGNLLLTLTIIFASTSALNATIYSATRALYALGRDHMVPHFFSRVSKKQKTPWISLLTTACLVIIVITLLPTIDVASSASMMFIILFFLVNICVIKVRWNMSDELKYGFIMPMFPAFPLIAIICQSILAFWLIHMSLIAWIIVPCWIIIGVAIYYIYSKSHTLSTAEEIHILEEKKASDTNAGYRVMVAVANPQNAVQMVRTTRELCTAKKARIELLHMVPVPDHIPLTDADKYMLEGKEAIVEAMLYLQPRFSFSSTIRYCRNIARGIVSAVREKKINMLIMGWHGKARSRGFNLGSTVDPIIERAPCHVVILKNSSNHNLKKILVPLAGGPNGAFALEIAHILAEKDAATICVFTVLREKNQFNIENFVNYQKKRLNIPEERIFTKVHKSVNVIEEILNESEQHDLIVIGSTKKPMIYNVAKESIPETIAQRCKKPLIMVKAAEGIESLIKRWI
jgi:amino acid transporter